MSSFWSRFPRFALGAAVCLAPSAAHAAPAVADCDVGDAPGDFEAADCNSVCTVSGNELVCRMETLCPTASFLGSSATAVTTFGASSHDVSAWGSCFGGAVTKFCCVFDENDGAIDTVGIQGTDDPDEALSFVHNLGGGAEENLQPWDADAIDGFIRGQGGADLILGSNYAGSDYDDNLYGQLGNDAIDGNGGADFLSGGDGADLLDGQDGNDTLWGGDGNDAHEGGAGVDALCDASGYAVCASNQGNHFLGGAGDDRQWFNQSENPLVPCPGILLDSTSDAGAGNDQCGDNNDFTTTQFGLDCQSFITVVPNRCIGAN